MLAELMKQFYSDEMQENNSENSSISIRKHLAKLDNCHEEQLINEIIIQIGGDDFLSSNTTGLIKKLENPAFTAKVYLRYLEHLRENGRVSKYQQAIALRLVNKAVNNKIKHIQEAAEMVDSAGKQNLRELKRSGGVDPNEI